MRAVIYARYSTDKQRDASIQDQIRNCKKFALQEEFTVEDSYSDEAISGSTNNRPGYQQMLEDAQAKKFDILIVDDLSRLSRDDVEMKQAVRRFRFRGQRIIGVSDGFDSDSKGHKIHAGVRGLINEIYLDDIREKTHRGLTGQALKGFNCGGKCYGYKHIPILDGARLDEYGRPIIVAVKRKVDPDQAPWVVKVFEWYADGYSPRWIAEQLNKEAVPTVRNGTWASSAINGDPKSNTGFLNNELYIGRYVWNRSQWLKDPDTGRRLRHIRPEEDWIVKDMPELRIISDELWQRVKERQKSIHEKSRNLRLALHDRARTGAGHKYLFSGLLKCGCCDANYILVDYYRYGCAVHKDRGPAACANKLKVSRKLLEQALLSGIRDKVFTPEGIEIFKQETIRLLDEIRKQDNPNIEHLQKRLKQTEKEIENIMNAIKAGIITPATKSELQKAETARADINRRLKADASQLDNIAVMLPRAVDRYRDILTNLDTVIQREVIEARRYVSALIGERIVLRPSGEDRLLAELEGDYAGLLDLSGLKCKKNLVAGAGMHLCRTKFWQVNP